MDDNGKALCKAGDTLFEQKTHVLQLWEELAQNFYPTGGGFTTEFQWGRDYAANLFDSYPLLIARELSNTVGAVTRPMGRLWFGSGVNRDVTPSEADALSVMTEIHYDVQNDRSTGIERVKRQTDADIAVFGNCATYTRPSPDRSHPISIACHLRDIAWQDGMNGEADRVHYKMHMDAVSAFKFFGKDAKLHHDIKEAADKHKDTKFEFRHVMMPVEDYEYYKKPPKKGAYVSVFYDVKHKMIVAEQSADFLRYSIGRWNRVAGSQYGYSPASLIALPDARTLQQIGYILLTAGERVVDPPMVATDQATKSGIDLLPGGITYIDRDYDERTGNPIRPIEMGKGLPYGFEIKADARSMLTEAFFLNKLKLPDGTAKTAYETQELVQEYMRSSAPVFEPLQVDYNARMLETEFNTLVELDTFGDILPPSLGGEEVKFTFSNELQDSLSRSEATRFSDLSQLLATSIQLDQSLPSQVEVVKGFREAVKSIGAEKWLVEEDQVQQPQMPPEMMQALAQGADELAA